MAADTSEKKLPKTDAERAKEYRERKKRALELSAKSAESTTDKRIHDSQRKFRERSGTKKLESFKSQDNGFICFLEAGSKTSFVVTRFYNGRSRTDEFSEIVAARRHFDDLKSGLVPASWKTIEDYTQDIETSIAKGTKITDLKVGHIIAFGFIEKRSQKKDKLNWEKSYIETQISLFGDLEMTFQSNNFINLNHQIIEKVIEYHQSDDGSSKKEESIFFVHSRTYRRGLELAHKYIKILPDDFHMGAVSGVFDQFKNEWKRVKKDIYKTGSNHQPLTIDQIHALFSYSHKNDPSLFYSILLCLSLGARPEEYAEYCLKPTDYIQPSTFMLNHNGTLPGLKLYNKKGVAMADSPSAIKNPTIQFLTYYLSRFEPIKELTPSFESNSVLRQIPKLKEVKVRSLRTTTATYIAMAGASQWAKYRATLYDVQERLGHTTLKRAIETYARFRVSAEFPEDYMKPNHKEDLPEEWKIDGVDITIGCNLWDYFLLDQYLRFKIQQLSKEQLEEFKKHFLNEYIKYVQKAHPKNASEISGAIKKKKERPKMDI